MVFMHFAFGDHLSAKVVKDGHLVDIWLHQLDGHEVAYHELVIDGKPGPTLTDDDSPVHIL